MLALILASALAFTEADAKLAYSVADGLVSGYTPRDAGTIRGRLAANYILDEASKVGADVRRDAFTAMTPLGERQFINLYAEYQVSSDASWVVVVSHYDTKTGVDCPGANDGASSTGLLVGIANAIATARELGGNVMLAWVDGEEAYEKYGENDGLWGSRRAVEYVRRRGYDVRAVICVDMIGDRDLHITIPKNGSRALADLALYAAKKAGYPDLVATVDEIVRDDHAPFVEAGYKAIDLIDFRYGGPEGGNDYWHTSADTMDKISVDSLLATGKVVTELLVSLHRTGRIQSSR